MRYAQECHGVESFPLFKDPNWTIFLRAVDEELVSTAVKIMPFAACHRENILFALTIAATVDSKTRRMRFDSEENTWGRELGTYFPELALDMFKLSQGIRGFAEVGQ
jgi:hypothetical protein